MAVTDDLFQLIRSLTPSEKRYFKIHAKTHVGDKYKNSYEKLFDALNYWTEEEYDEQLFKRKHKGKSFIKNLSVEKNYLYELIMVTMRSFTNKKTIDQQINDLLLDEEFFRQKRLNKQRQKAIEKGKALAKEFEKLPALLTLLDRESTMQKEWKQNELEALSKESNIEEQEVLHLLQAHSRLRYLSNRLFMKVRINTNNSSADLKTESLQLLTEPAVKNYEIGLSFGCDYHYYRIQAMHYRIHRDLKQHCLFSKQLFDLYEIHYPQQKQSNIHGYKIALYNYLNACFTVGNLSAFPALLEKAKSLPSSTKDEEGEDWQNHIHLQLIYLLNTGELEKATALRPEIDKGIARYKNKVNKARELALYYNLATAYFLCGNWVIAFNYYNKVLQDNTDARKDLKYIAELLLAALQFELGNSDLTEYLRRNIERRFKDSAQYEGIKTYFKFIGAMAQGKTLSKPEIESLYKLFEPNIELSYWIRSKVEKKKITAVFIEQLKSAQEPK